MQNLQYLLISSLSGVFFFVLNGIVVALLALRACKGNSDSHNGTSIDYRIIGLPLFGKQGTKKEPSLRGKDQHITIFRRRQRFF